MTEENKSENENSNDDLIIPTELESLKIQADKLGVPFRDNIGVDKLRERVNAKINGEPEKEATKKVPAKVITREVAPEIDVNSKQYKYKQIRMKAEKLVRIRVSCMNPNKKSMEGDFFTVSNRAIGTIKKFVPFDNDEGWHVPSILVQMIKDKKCQVFIKGKDRQGRKTVKPKQIREYSVEVMDPLNKQELKDLTQRQAMSGSIQED